MVLILFGVSGAGKTTLGKHLAVKLGWQFYDADDFHSQANIDLMEKGIPLRDEQRWPWLERLSELITKELAAKENAVLACSALKKAYREYLTVGPQVRFVYLRGSYELIANQIRHRSGHFMPSALLQTQFTTLEEPEPTENTIIIQLGRPEQELVDEIRSRLGL